MQYLQLLSNLLQHFSQRLRQLDISLREMQSRGKPCYLRLSHAKISFRFDRLRPIRDSLASMEGRFGRVEGGPTLPVQHTSDSSSQIPAPHSSPAPSLQATTPTPPLAPAVSSEQASRMRVDNFGVSAQPALVSSTPFSQPVLVRRSPFSRFPWYQMEK